MAYKVVASKDTRIPYDCGYLEYTLEAKYSGSYVYAFVYLTLGFEDAVPFETDKVIKKNGANYKAEMVQTGTYDDGYGGRIYTLSLLEMPHYILLLLLRAYLYLQQ